MIFGNMIAIGHVEKPKMGGLRLHLRPGLCLFNGDPENLFMVFLGCQLACIWASSFITP
jgi:hypothetical protein